MSYLDKLNVAQRRAVEHVEGPCLIIAGPGSGKTRVLTYRIAHLLEQGVDAFHVLALTFTNKASNEMRERIEQVVGTRARSVYMGTFHSIFARMLRYDADKIGYPSNFTIYDTQDAKNLIKRIVKDMGLDDKLYKPNIVFNRISAAKNNLITSSQYIKNTDVIAQDHEAGRPKIGEIYVRYQASCFKSGAMDFDDLLLNMYILLVKNPKVLLAYQHRFKYVLVDEFQDTNFAQYEIIRKLADVHQNITVVGDDAQSIYAFRGATIQNILHFETNYPSLKSFKLEQNYRSTKSIISAANAIISHNKGQIAKQIWTENIQGDQIDLHKCPTDSEEARLIGNIIFERKAKQHFDYSDFAILYRTNAQSRSFEEALRKLNIPYVIYGGLSFYQRKEVKDILAYLKLVVNPYEEESLRRIVNYPTRGISLATIQKLSVAAAEHNVRLWDVLLDVSYQQMLPSRAKNCIQDFVAMIKSFRLDMSSKNAFDIASDVAKQSGLLTSLYNDRSVEGISRYENIQELLNGIKAFSEDDLSDLEDDTSFIDRTLGAYLQDISLLTNQEDEQKEETSVKLMSIHSAKGLEFKNVFIVGLEEKLFPSSRSLYSREGLEEERRLFYVAITRAEHYLTLSYANSRYQYGKLEYCQPSRFLDEIPATVLFLKTGKSIKGRPSFKSPSKERTVTGGARPKLKPIKKIQGSKSLYSSHDFRSDDLTNLKEGMNVLHPRFGKGVVVEIIRGNHAVANVSFEDFGDKRLMLRFAKMQIL